MGFISSIPSLTYKLFTFEKADMATFYLYIGQNKKTLTVYLFLKTLSLSLYSKKYHLYVYFYLNNTKKRPQNSDRQNDKQ